MPHDATHRLTRRHLVALMAVSPVVLAPLSALANGEPGSERFTGDIVLGDADAPVEVIEYASFTCPHCAAFHQNTWPEFKKQYVDTGKVRFIMREVYFDPYGLWAGMIARCGGEEGYYPLVDAFLKRQRDWARAEDVAAEIQKIGRLNGLSSEAMRACLSDRAYAETLVGAYQENAQRDGVQSTPSFLINGELVSGNMGFDELAALVDRHL